MNVPFEELQGKLMRRFGELGFAALESGTMVLIPSITFPIEELRKITGIVFYEERLLCVLLMLRNPKLRIVYVTSMPIDTAIVDYYLRWLTDAPSARERLSFVSLDDPAPRALSEKLVEDPAALERIKDAIEDPEDAFIVPFNVTQFERRVAEELEVPIYGIDPKLSTLGTKTGSRRAARLAGVPLLDGAEGLGSPDEVEAAMLALRTRSPSARSMVIKLNNGFSGQGNAIMDSAKLTSPLADSPTTFCAETETWETYAEKIVAEGAVIEELVRLPGTVSPSVQLRVGPHGEVEVLSTHDQILGGPDEQVYLGCRFPAQVRYRHAIRDAAVKVAALLAERGVIGPFGIDFVVTQDGDRSDVFLSEINLRMGGTTHPMIMARNLTRGRYDAVSDELTADGLALHYIASDNLKSKALVGMSPEEAIGALDRSGLSFDALTNTGATLHLLGALRDHGKLGTLCIADSPKRAQELYDSVIRTLDEVAARRG